MDESGGRWSRRSVLAGAGSALTLGSGCLDRSPTRQSSDWPQRGYDAGATFYKSDASPPVEDVEVGWTANVDSTLYNAINRQWRSEDRYRDLTTYLGTIDKYARTPIVVVGGHAHLTERWGTVVDLSDGTVTGYGPSEGRFHGPCENRVLVGAARTDTYKDGTIVGAVSFGPSGDFVMKGFRPPADGEAWCTGAQRWAAGAPRDFERTAAAGRIADGTVVTVLPDREPPYRIVALDADDGRIEWENTVSHGIHRLRVEDGVAYASVTDEEGGRLTILDGSSIRQRVAIEPTDLLAAVRDGVAYFRDFRAESAAPSIKAIDAGSGETRRLLDGPTVSEQISGAPTGVGDIVVGPDRLFAAVTTGTGSAPTVLALNRSDGTIEWVRQLSGPLRLTGTSDALYVAGPREPGPHAYALEPASGDSLWSIELPDRTGFGLGVYRPVVAHSKVLVPLDGVLVALEEP